MTQRRSVVADEYAKGSFEALKTLEEQLRKPSEDKTNIVETGQELIVLSATSVVVQFATAKPHLQNRQGRGRSQAVSDIGCFKEVRSPGPYEFELGAYGEV